MSQNLLSIEVFLLLIAIASHSVLSEVPIKCSSIETGGWGQVIGTVKYCTLEKSLVIEKQNTEITGTRDDSIEAVQINHASKVNYSPRGLVNVFPNMKAFAIQYCSLKAIDKEDLKEFGTKLESLFLYETHIEFLPNDLIAYNPNLREFSSYGSKLLKHIESGFFEQFTGMNKIEIIDFRYSSCINQNYKLKTHGNISNFKWNHNCSDEIVPSRKEKKKLADLEILKATLKRTTNYKAALKLMRNSEGNSNNAQINRSNIMTCQFYGNLTECKYQTESKNSEISAVHHSEDKKEDVTDVTSMLIYDVLMMYIPKNLHTLFNNLIELRIVSTGLSEVNKDDLQFKNLRMLDLSHNNLMNIPVDLFEKMELLEVLDLSYNNIEIFNSKSIVFLNSLEALYLNENEMKYLSGDFIDVFLSMNAKSFKIIDLSKNLCIDVQYPSYNLTEVVEKISEYCVEPVKMSCESDNDVNDSEMQMSDSLCKVTGKLKIVHKKRRIMTEKVDESKKSLVIIEQQVEFMPYKLAESFISLEELIISKCGLRQLNSWDFDELSKLKKLELTNNNISSIGDKIFDPLTSLEVLDLSANGIVKLSQNVFSALANLKTLDLSDNEITHFYASYLPPGHKIQSLEISKNKIEYFEYRAIKSFKKSIIIDLEGNTCIDAKFNRSINSTADMRNLFSLIDFDCEEEQV